MVADQIRDLARRLVRAQPLGQAAQVFDQHHAQRRRQRPELAEREFASLLVSTEKAREQLFVERAIGVRDEGPRDAIDARQAGQRRVDQHRQVLKVAPWQTLVNLAELAFDQMKVVEQPLGRGADVVAAAGVVADVVLGFAQRADVVFEARKKGRRAARRDVCAMRLTEAATVLAEALRPKNLRAVRRLDRAAAAVEDVEQRLRCVGDQPAQVG